MSRSRKELKFLLGMSAGGLSLFGLRTADAASFGLSFTDGGTWNTNYAQGFSPSVAPNPVPGSAAGDPAYLSRFAFFKSGTADGASNIQLAIINGLFSDLTNLSTTSPAFVGLSTNTIPATATLSTGNPVTFSFNDLQLTYGNDYAAVFVNVGSGGELTPVLVSSLTTNYTDIGGGNYHPTTNYGTESQYQYSVSNFKHTDSFGTYFDSYSFAGDANFAASLSTAPAARWNTAGSGNWNAASNWTAAGVPNEAGAPVVFGTGGGSGAVTIATDVNVLAGTVRFDTSAASYTVAGPNAITLDVPAGWAWLGSNAGTHAISAPLALADNTEVSVAAGSTLTASNLQASAVTLLKTGGGTFQTNRVRGNGLTVSAGTVQMLPDTSAAGVSRVNILTLAPGASLDLSANKLITTVTPVGSWNGSAYTDITGLIASGRNTGGWGGSGIVTSQSLATGGNYASIGVARASDVRPNSASATELWAGQTITGTDTLVMYTYGGDATLDGKINIDDYVRIDSGIAAGLTGWSNGDFNYDGKVSIDDYITIIDANIGNQNGVFFTASGANASGVSAVPEPAAASLLALAGGMTLVRRRNRRRR
jgi:hypothetical protein